MIAQQGLYIGGTNQFQAKNFTDGNDGQFGVGLGLGAKIGYNFLQVGVETGYEFSYTYFFRRGTSLFEGDIPVLLKLSSPLYVDTTTGLGGRVVLATGALFNFPYSRNNLLAGTLLDENLSAGANTGLRIKLGGEVFDGLYQQSSAFVVLDLQDLANWDNLNYIRIGLFYEWAVGDFFPNLSKKVENRMQGNET